MGRKWVILAVAIPAIVAAVALYLAVDNIARAGPGSAPAAAPSVPTVISYQGRLADPGTGQPVADGSYNMQFAIYDAAAAGTLLWQEPATGSIPVPVAGGVFTHLLGSNVALSPSIFAGGNTYLQVFVNGETLSPRQQIGAVAYALVAETLSVPSSLSGNVADPDALLTVNNTGTGYAGFFSSAADHLDLALGGAVGRINTDPSNENSDLYLSSNNDAIIKLDNDGGENGVLRVKNSGGDDVCTVDESGNLSCMGDGLVKAAVVVNADGTVNRWFNNVNGLAPTVTKSDTGRYSVDFQFQVNDRFLAVSVAEGAGTDAEVVSYVYGTNNVLVQAELGDGTNVDRQFQVIIY